MNITLNRKRNKGESKGATGAHANMLPEIKNKRPNVFASGRFFPTSRWMLGQFLNRGA
jgi:hypothetical protein